MSARVLPRRDPSSTRSESPPRRHMTHAIAPAASHPFARRDTSAAAAAATPLAEAGPDALLKALGVMLLVYVWRAQDFFPILGKLQFPALASLCALAFYVASRHPWRRLLYVRSPTTWLACGLVALMLAGVPTSLWPGHSLSFVLTDQLKNIVFMGLVVASARSVRDIEWYAKLNLYGALFYATVVNVFFSAGPDGRLGNLAYYDSNDFALVITCTIPFAVYYLRPGSGAKRRALGLLSLGLFVFCIVRSGSRGGFIALVVVLLFVLLRYRAIPSRVRLLAAVAGVGLLTVIGSESYWTQIRTMLHPKTDYTWTDPEGRRQVWERGIGYVKAHPVFGVGVAAYPIAEGTLSELGRERQSRGRGFKWSVAHNSFLETAAELGIPGLLVFLAMLGVTMRALSRIRPGPRYGPWIGKRETALGQMMLGALIAFSVGGFFVSAEYFSYLYFLLGLSIALDKVLRLRRDATMAALTAHLPPVRLAAAPAAAGAAFGPRGS